jgi:hypothetical protein
MIRWSLLSAGVICATFLSLHSSAYAFEKQPTGGATPAPAATEPQPMTDWDAVVENSLIFSNPFADKSEIEPTPHTFLKAGIADNVNLPSNGSSWQPGIDTHDQGTLGVAETGFRPGSKNQIGVVGWQYTAKPDFTSPTQKSSSGMYILAERNFFNNDGKSVLGYAQAGRAQAAPGEIQNGFTTGFELKGFVPSRPDGKFNFAFSGGATAPFAQGTTTSTAVETRFELTYEDKVSDNVTVQPGLNYTTVRGNDPTVPVVNGLVAGVRVHVKFK